MVENWHLLIRKIEIVRCYFPKDWMKNWEMGEVKAGNCYGFIDFDRAMARREKLFDVLVLILKNEYG